MPRFAEHSVIGVGTGALYSLVVQHSRQTTAQLQIAPMHLIGCAIAGFLGSCLPDKLEPADQSTGPNHRGAVHSASLLALMVEAVRYFATLETKSEFMRLLADLAGAFCAGLSSHLVADLFTPRGLNLAVKGF